MTVRRQTLHKTTRKKPRVWQGLLGLFVVGFSCSTDPNPEQVLPELPSLPPQIEKPLPPAEAVQPVREARIALIGEVRGEVEPCGCPTLPYGGFARRERLLDELRQGPTPLFHLDAGDTLMKGFSADRQDVDARAAAIVHMSEMVGVDVWAPGPSDLQAVGVAGLRDSNLTVVSATWANADGSLLFAPTAVVERDGVRLGVVGLSGQPSDATLREQLVFRDPVDAARDGVMQFPADVDLMVGLGSLSAEEAARVAREVPQLAAVLSTQGGGYEEPHDVDGQGMLIEVPDRGRYISVLHVRLGAGPSAALRLLPSTQRWRERLTLRQQLHQESNSERRAALDEVEAEFTAVGAGRNLVYVDVFPLSGAYDGPANVDAHLESFLGELVESATTVAAQEPTVLEPGYAAAGSCSNCHVQEFARWTYTDHAQSAWLSLVERDATENPECVTCHSTGFGEVGGFGELNAANLRKFKGVQCEACHGPMRGHNGRNEVSSRPISQASCTGCHDQANSPDFDFATYLPRATCQSPATP